MHVCLANATTQHNTTQHDSTQHNAPQLNTTEHNATHKRNTHKQLLTSAYKAQKSIYFYFFIKNKQSKKTKNKYKSMYERNWDYQLPSTMPQPYSPRTLVHRGSPLPSGGPVACPSSVVRVLVCLFVSLFVCVFVCFCLCLFVCLIIKL